MDTPKDFGVREMGHAATSGGCQPIVDCHPVEDGFSPMDGYSVAKVAAAVTAFRIRPHRQGSAAERRANLISLRHAIDLLELEFSKLAADFAQTDDYEAQGSTSPTDWIRHNCNISGNAASLALCIGEQMEHLPESVRAVESGEIGRGHLALLARTYKYVAEHSPELRFDETPLLAKAKEHSVGKFSFDCDHVRHQADSGAFLSEHLDAVERRRLELLTCENGDISVRGLLDPVGGATLRTVLQPLAQPNGVGDKRDRERRMADALVELAHHGLDTAVAPQQAQERPHLQVTTSVETLIGSPRAPAGDMEFSSPIPGKTVQRLACDSSVSRLVLNAKSEVIDVGRRFRIANGAIRRALTHRDKGCVWPGCERPPSWTQAHHLHHWANGGRTDLNNLVLVCHRHHQMVHEGGWQLARSADGAMTAIPTFKTYHSPHARPPNIFAT